MVVLILSERDDSALCECEWRPATSCFLRIIGERERANLVVQLARFSYIFRHTVILYVILNTRQRNFTYTVSRACANIYRFDLTRQLYYSWQVCALLLVVGLYCNPRGATRAEISYALAEINWKSLEITEIWLEIRNQDPVEIRKSARNHKRNNEKHPLFV